MPSAMLRAAVLAAAAACVVGVRKNNHAVSVVDEDQDMERVGGEGLLAEKLAEKWCTLEDHTLSCAEGSVIQVVKALYNRQRREECNPPIRNSSTECSVTITDSVAAACDRLRECAVPASFHSSSCPEYSFTYIRVSFECVAGVSEREDFVEAWDFERKPDQVWEPIEEERLIEALTTTLPSLEALTTTMPTASTGAPRYSSFNVWVKTSDKWWSGTDDTVYVQLLGEGGKTDWTKLDYLFQNDFERGSLQVYPVHSAMPVALTVVCLKKMKVGFWNDSWRPDSVKVYEGVSQSAAAKMIGWADGWGVIEDEEPVCKRLHLS